MASPKKATTKKPSKQSTKSNSSNKNTALTKKAVSKAAIKQLHSDSSYDPSPVPVPELTFKATMVLDTPKAKASIRGPSTPIFYPFTVHMGEGTVYIDLSKIRRVAKYNAQEEASQISDGQTNQLVKHSVAEVMSIIGAHAC